MIDGERTMEMEISEDEPEDELTLVEHFRLRIDSQWLRRVVISILCNDMKFKVVKLVVIKQ